MPIRRSMGTAGLAPARTPALRQKAQQHVVQGFLITSRLQEPAPPVRNRSKGVALVMALFGGLSGLHRFYLGYTGQGYASIVLALLVVPFVAFVGGIAGSATAGILMLSGIGAWLLVDIIRILMGKLKPRNGNYYPRLFQIRPKPENTPPNPAQK
ncbi:TM2 domain-containing protein [Hymenobacter sp. BT770]|uniref:TM2 domain-containing protein n=1 Tax=Hymenobacter sp. BT770 TaxID=2886942 RepID=UPI001D10033D|nr:TM2 domain-containing protein [Hymenobacter sp. BT770]MCC3152833.1 TM2 domain-containing protein [Hymenobacter sp. BT770]MDO3414908.1 TM2 domain-containing protein [Hymenobacter sp. BT770]